jgi:hypothetical protein
METNRIATISATVSHLLAWALFLWIVTWQCVDQCDFFLDANGLWFLTAMFIPVILTGLAVVTLFAWTASRLGPTLVLGVLSIAFLAFCGMGYLSYGWGYLPSALALTTAAIFFGVRPGAGKRHRQEEDWS